jgi:hypothetical protein
MYDTERIKPDVIHNYINQIHANLQHNPTYEDNGRMSCPDLVIIRNSANLEIDIYRNPTTTDTTISFISIDPNEHITAAYRYHINGMCALPLTEERQQTEWKIIQSIAQNNNFPEKLVTKLKLQAVHKNSHQKTTGCTQNQPPENRHRRKQTQEMGNVYLP